MTTPSLPSSPQPARATPDPERTSRRLRSTSREAYARDLALFERFGGRLPCGPADLSRLIDALRNRVAPRTDLSPRACDPDAVPAGRTPQPC
jgi:hypothetical protein